MFLAALFTTAKQLGATQVSTDGWMDKQNVVYAYNNGILFSLNEEGNSDLCYNLDEPRNLYAKWNKPDIKEQILYDFTYMSYLE